MNKYNIRPIMKYAMPFVAAFSMVSSAYSKDNKVDLQSLLNQKNDIVNTKLPGTDYNTQLKQLSDYMKTQKPNDLYTLNSKFGSSVKAKKETSSSKDGLWGVLALIILIKINSGGGSGVTPTGIEVNSGNTINPVGGLTTGAGPNN